MRSSLTVKSLIALALLLALVSAAGWGGGQVWGGRWSLGLSSGTDGRPNPPSGTSATIDPSEPLPVDLIFDADGGDGDGDGEELEVVEVGDDEVAASSDSPSSPKPGDSRGGPVGDSVDDIAEADMDEDEDDAPMENNLSSAEMGQLQAVLSTLVQAPDSPEHLESLIASNVTEESSRDRMYRLLLRQFTRPLRSPAVLDTEAVLSLKGLCNLAQRHNPTLSALLPVRRGVRLVSPAVEDASGSGASLAAAQMLVVRALMQALQSHWIVFNDRVLAKVRAICQKERLLAGIALTKVDVLKALVRLVHQAPSPEWRCCVILSNDLRWLTSDDAASQLLHEEMQIVRSKLLLVSLGAAAPKRPPPTARDDLSMASPLSMAGPPAGFAPGLLPMPPGFAPMPPGMMPGQVLVRGFQVSIANGTATLTPLPPSAQPPPEVLRKILEGARLPPNFPPGNASVAPVPPSMMPPFPPGGISFPMFPPDMAEEEVQEYMQDPDNQPRIKALLDQVLQAYMQQQLPPADLRAQMMSVPFAVQPNTVGHHMPPPLPPQLPNMNAMRPRASEDTTGPRQSGSAAGSAESRPSHFGELLSAQFEELPLAPPTDHALKQLWATIVEEDRARRVFAHNKRLLTSHLASLQLFCAPTLMGGVRDALSRRALTRDDVRRAIAHALQLQAGQCQDVLSPRTAPSTSASVSVSVSAPTGDCQLQLWALDLALGSVLQLRGPGIRPAVLTKDDILATLDLDKHEKSLVDNLIFPRDIGVSYDMIGGLADVKTALKQCVTFPLKYPKLYQNQGLASEAVKGVLLFGPPGTGKTMLAKAVATEGGAAFLSIDASTIENKWLGESEKNARAVFSLARKLSPCVVFLDEVDSVLSSREHSDESSHGTLTSVKTTLMQEWDGLRTTKDRVVVIASTNRPFDLDEAVLRRLPRRVLVDLPDLATRTDILRVSLRRNAVAPQVNLTALAVALEGYTGSDIKEVCREACVRVAHERAAVLEAGDEWQGAEELQVPLRAVEMDDFQQAMRKLKASVDETGRELGKVLDWNEKYGEVKRTGKRRRPQLSLYI